jgi:formylmethanofuran dehydrogenase subunit E
MTPKRNIPPKITSILKKATELHGHLGPFLAIGVRMGLVGLDRIGPTNRKSLAVTASLPLRVPFSCIIDGLQISTQCTVGNQKLSLKNSSSIHAKFKRKEDEQEIIIALNKSTFEKLKSQLLQKRLSDDEVRKLAWKIVRIPESELFVIT